MKRKLKVGLFMMVLVVLLGTFIVLDSKKVDSKELKSTLSYPESDPFYSIQKNPSALQINPNGGFLNE